jgi:hypothetical protein
MEFHVDTEDKEIFRVSTDRTMLNVPLIHQFLSGQSTGPKVLRCRLCDAPSTTRFALAAM